MTVNFVIAVKKCGKAVRLLEMTLGGKVDMLSPDCLADLEALFDHHKPNHANMTLLYHMVVTIFYTEILHGFRMSGIHLRRSFVICTTICLVWLNLFGRMRHAFLC